MKAAKRNQWPLASVRQDGMPAIWLTHSLWMCIRDSLVSRYVRERVARGERRARLELKQPDKMADTFLWQYCEHDAEKSAMELYRIGSAAYFKPEHRTESQRLSPEDLIALGDKREEQAYHETLKKLMPPREEEAA